MEKSFDLSLGRVWLTKKNFSKINVIWSEVRKLARRLMLIISNAAGSQSEARYLKSPPIRGDFLDSGELKTDKWRVIN